MQSDNGTEPWLHRGSVRPAADARPRGRGAVRAVLPAPAPSGDPAHAAVDLGRLALEGARRRLQAGFGRFINYMRSRHRIY